MKWLKISLFFILISFAVLGQDYNPSLAVNNRFIDSLKKVGVDTIIELSYWNGGGVRPIFYYRIFWKRQNTIYERICGDIFAIGKVPYINSAIIKDNNPFKYFIENRDSIKDEPFVTTNGGCPSIEIYVFMRSDTFKKYCNYMEVKSTKKNEKVDYLKDSGKDIKEWLNMFDDIEKGEE